DAGRRRGTVRHPARLRPPRAPTGARALRLPRRQVRFHHRHLLGPAVAAARGGDPQPDPWCAPHHPCRARHGAGPMRPRGSPDHRSRDRPAASPETDSHIGGQKETVMRRRTVLTGLALSGLAATGCSDSGSGGGGGGDVDVSDTEMEATIEFAAWEADFDWESVIEGFNQTYPNITVQMTKTPFKDFFTRLQTQASGDNLPDAFMMNGPNFQLYASHGIIASFENAVEAGELDFANYPEAMHELYTYEDVAYGVPTSYDSIGLWYNEDLFEKAGVEVPTDEWAWEDLHEAAKEISEALGDEGIYGFAGGAYNQELFYNLI